MTVWLLIGALLGSNTTPFEDLQGRFHLELPLHWAFAPKPGDVEGAVFERREDNLLGFVSLQIMMMSSNITPKQLITQFNANLAKEPNFILLQQQQLRHGGRYAAAQRRYRQQVPLGTDLNKMVVERVVFVPLPSMQMSEVLVIHCESLAENFSFFEADMQTITNSVLPGRAPRPTIVAKPSPPIAKQIQGVWLGTNHQLTLTPNFQLLLDGGFGIYALLDGVFIFHVDGKIYHIQFDVHDNVLWLAGGPFGKGQTLVRTSQ